MKTKTKPPKRKAARRPSDSVWQLQQAKDRLSELVERVLRGEEQTITRHGRPVARLVPATPGEPKESIAEFIRNSPLYGVKLDLRRDRSLPREIEL